MLAGAVKKQAEPMPEAEAAIPSGYKRTELGVIPEDWSVKTIGEMNTFVTSGSRGWATYYSEIGSPFVRITNMTRYEVDLDLEDLKYVKIPEDSSEGTRTALKVGDLLVSITANIGIVSYVDDRLPKPAYINQHIAMVRFNDANTGSKYVAYYLASNEPQKNFKSLTDQGAKAGMSLETVRKIKFVSPPLPEQQAIAEALSDVDGWVASLDALIAKKRDLKTATMQQLLTGHTRLPGFSGEWETKKLGDLAKIQRGASPRPIDSPIWFDENSSIGWVRISDVTKSNMYLLETTQRLSALGVQHSRPVSRGSLIMSICATVGRPIITAIDVCIHDGFVVFDNLQAQKMYIFCAKIY